MNSRIAFDVDRWRVYDCTTDEIIVGLRDPEYILRLQSEGVTQEEILEAVQELSVAEVGTLPTDNEVQAAINKLLSMEKDLA
jgi:hypothetical protein